MMENLTVASSIDGSKEKKIAVDPGIVVSRSVLEELWISSPESNYCTTA
jgi:hypothetical protein